MGEYTSDGPSLQPIVVCFLYKLFKFALYRIRIAYPAYEVSLI